MKLGRVFADGQLAAENENHLLPVPKAEYSSWARDTIRFGRTLTADDCAIRVP